MPSPPPPRVEAFRSIAETAKLKDRLDALNLASRRPSPFGTFAYMQAFTAHDEFATPGQELLLLVAFDGDAPVGFLPLRKVPERLYGLPQPSIRFLMSHDNDRPRAVARTEDEPRCCEAFYRYLLQEERGWSFLELIEQDDASGLLDPPPSLLRSRYYLRRFPTNPNATITIAPYQTLDDYLHAMEGKRRKNFRYAVRKLLDDRPIELVSSSDPAALPSLFELYLDLERRSWKVGARGHIARHPERVAFFRSLLAPSSPIRMTIYLLLQDDLPIAGIVNGSFEGDLYAFEEAFDEAYRRIAPGNTVLLYSIGDAIERRHRTFNLFGNYAYYKAHWLATITETVAVQIFRKGSLVHGKARVGELWRRLRPPVTQREVDFNLARRDAAEDDDAKSAPSELPARPEERERAKAAFRALEATTAELKRLSPDALRRALLGDETDHGRKGKDHDHGPKVNA